MLCKKIVISKEENETLDEIGSYMSRQCIDHTLKENEDVSTVSFVADDEKLYDLCQFLADTVLKRKIENRLKRYITKTYGCFNSDECKVILGSVLNCELARELPGRIYIYLKINKSINPHGFYDFMCKDVTDYILDCASEEAEKLIAMNDNNDFIEILKCFSDLSPGSSEMVEISADSTGLKISACYPGRGDCLSEYAGDDADVLSELIALNPDTILVHGKEEFLRNDMSSVITAVFDGRIEYSK